MKKIVVIGSHGLEGKYGGWDQLVINLAEKHDDSYELYIVNPAENKLTESTSINVKIINSRISGFGIKGLILDYFYTLKLCSKADGFLFLGCKGFPAFLIARLLNKNIKSFVNIGGIEWLRPQYNFFIKLYLKLCFKLTIAYANSVIIDNEFYKTFTHKRTHDLNVIPYGGYIDTDLVTNSELLREFPFIQKDYYLSISRSIPDNKVQELCEVFKLTESKELVLICNFSATAYGKNVYDTFKNQPNITLIDGLYDKKKLDFVRRKCKAYIHTHTLCGSAPSLIEMIVCKKPIISIDVPQNRYTLNGEGVYFQNFEFLSQIINSNDIIEECSDSLTNKYTWASIIDDYDKCMLGNW
jgi:hypothetical protein